MTLSGSNGKEVFNFILQIWADAKIDVTWNREVAEMITKTMFSCLEQSTS